MKGFIKQVAVFILFGMFPFIIPLTGYLYLDPFKVLYTYNDYSNPYVLPNRDYVSTEMFIKNEARYKYNSFIFGSSRTLAFRPASWQIHLSKNDSPYMFDASGETIYGIYSKIKYLDSKNVKLNNVLIILCRDVAFSHSENQKGHIFIKHPVTSGESNIAFQIEFFKAYLNPKFLFSYYTYVITRKQKPFMSKYIEDRKITFDTITNELSIPDQETEITQNPAQFYLKRKDLFYNRKGEQIDSVQRINRKQLIMLQEVKRILEKNKTNYKVVISPLYDQIKFSNNDIGILKNLFGDNLFDFSGKNQFTESLTNYYEPSHYRPFVGDSILNIIYRSKPMGTTKVHN